MRRRIWFLCILLTMGATSATAGDIEQLLNAMSSLQANFEQISVGSSLSSPRTLTGMLYIKRPGKFRWDYQKPYEQHIVSNGKRVWLHDVDLEQVTVRRIDATIGDTPALLLSGSQSLDKSFKVEAQKDEGAAHWAKLTPKGTDAAFKEIRIAYENDTLKSMVMIDNLDQTTQIRFSNVKRNVSLADSLFEFAIPKGADVIDDTGR